MSAGRTLRREIERVTLDAMRGYSSDKRKRRRQHRRAARSLLAGGTLFNGKAPVGSIPWAAAQWHLHQARYFRR